MLREFFQNTMYVRVKPDWVSVLHVQSGTEIGDVPVVAYENKKGKDVVVAVGREAAAMAGHANRRLVNGFEHPRTPLWDFIAAEQVLRYLVKQVARQSPFSPSPIIVLHPLITFEAGLTPIEIRAFAELGLGAGARKVYLWEGQTLSQPSLRALTFPTTGGKLLFPENA